MFHARAALSTASGAVPRLAMGDGAVYCRRMTSRRSILHLAAGGLAAAALLARTVRAGLSQGTLDSATNEALPGKQPLLKRSYRPPNYETPLEYFDDVITPNERFFVRWHLANIPEIDATAWRLAVGGDAVTQELHLSLDELRHSFEPAELVAVCQCAGNRRGLSAPHVPGVQWGSGAMGNARWRGARLRDILARAGVRKEAVEIAFSAADRAPLSSTPPFVKSIPAWKALDENTLVAYEMNGEPLPHWNGFPARIVVPGWTATYWMKQVSGIQALAQPLTGFWMNTAYRIPKGKFPVVDRFISQESETSTPITEILVNSVITKPADGARLPPGAPITVAGLAWDAGAGIRRVEISLDGGHSWNEAELAPDPGRFSFRPWRFLFTPASPGQRTIMARASNAQGTTQPSELIFNPAGYHNNVVQTVTVEIA
jgi:DMSO/TMAO reductase YedYZ molybdopterin-dependent catalytic subunit